MEDDTGEMKVKEATAYGFQTCQRCAKICLNGNMLTKVAAHFCCFVQFLGFSGSSVPSHVTRKGSFSGSFALSRLDSLPDGDSPGSRPSSAALALSLVMVASRLNAVIMGRLGKMIDNGYV